MNIERFVQLMKGEIQSERGELEIVEIAMKLQDKTPDDIKKIAGPNQQLGWR